MITKGYQSFEDQIGSSNSYGKLEKLCMPDSFKGLYVLDIGCNEGFFCIDAINRGANRVVGIDSSPDFIKKAKERCNKVEYIHSNWWNLPNEKFDIIYFLSAIHYEERQKVLLDYICSHLNPKGMLVLECGVINNRNFDEKQWIPVYRKIDGYRKYPTMKYLTENLLDRFQVKYIGESVSQSGDSVERYVFHCMPKEISAILIRGDLQDVTLIHKFLRTNATLINADKMIRLIMKSDLIKKFTSKILESTDVNFDVLSCVLNLSENDLNDCINLIFDMCPMDILDIVIYGESLKDDRFFNNLIKKLQGKKINVRRFEVL